jgi:hypothetical protein
MYHAPMAAKRRAVTPAPKGTGNVVAFPPLPVPPRPPRFPPDTRQAQAMRIIGRIAGTARTSMRLAGPNVTTGFHASAVDLGRLQNALARGVARFDAAQIEARWDEVFAWMLRVLRGWVQRCKKMHVSRREAGIRVELETQDDHGYYSFGFDVFPGRLARPARSPA